LVDGEHHFTDACAQRSPLVRVETAPLCVALLFVAQSFTVSRASLSAFLLLTAIGLGLGLYLGWVAFPVQYINAEPSSLHPDYKDDYVLMIATLYSEDSDLDAARTQIVAVGFDDPGLAVADTTRRFIAAQRSEADLRRLVGLAAALGGVTPEMLPYLP
jgi:hypothetical protein